MFIGVRESSVIDKVDVGILLTLSLNRGLGKLFRMNLVVALGY